MTERTHAPSRGFLSKRSAFVAAALFCAALLLFLGMQLWTAHQRSDQAIIHDGEGNTHAVSLSQDQIITVTTSLGTNVIQIGNGSVRVIEADCPNHDCMQQGSIAKAGQQIVCLPHQLWIEIAGKDNTSGIDAQAR